MTAQTPSAVAPASAPPPAKKKRGGVVRWLLALVLMAAVVYFATRDPEPFLRLLDLEPHVALALVLLLTMNAALIAARLRLAVTFCGAPRDIAYKVWFRILVVGQLLNNVVPQLGNVYRAVTLRREHGVDYSTYAAGLFAFLWIDTMISALFAIVLITVVDPALAVGGYPARLLIGAVLLAEFIAPLVFTQVLKRVSLKPGRIARLKEKLSTLMQTATSAIAAPLFIIKLGLINVLVATVQMTALYLSFRAVGVEVDIAALALFQVVVKFSNHIVITPGNLGITELSWGLLSEATDRGLQEGVAAALLFRAAVLVNVLVLGSAFGGLGLLRRPLTDDDAQTPPR